MSVIHNPLEELKGQVITLEDRNDLLLIALGDIVNMRTYDPDDAEYMYERAKSAIEAQKS